MCTDSGKFGFACAVVVVATFALSATMNASAEISEQQQACMGDASFAAASFLILSGEQQMQLPAAPKWRPIYRPTRGRGTRRALGNAAQDPLQGIASVDGSLLRTLFQPACV